MPPHLFPRRLCFALFLALSVVAFPGQSEDSVGNSGQDENPTVVSLPADPAAIIACVGNTPILMGDLVARVDSQLKEAIARGGGSVPEDQLVIARTRMTRSLLQQTIQTKMMREAFLLDQVATQSAEKRREADDRLSVRARQMFFETEVPQLREQYKVEELAKLDAELRKKGSSLAARQREFMDAMLGHLYIRSKVDREPTVTVAEINDHYQTNLEEFQRPTRAKWEQLSVLFTNFTDRESAYEAIWEMGREAYFGGSMQAVAREKSQEAFASKGGLHDWTAKGSLASDVIDEQIFSIPMNAMSEIIEDDLGYHIVRVLEREEAGVLPLSEVQDTIRAVVREDKIQLSQREVLEDMQVMVPVWSLFPEDTPGAKPLPISIASRYSNVKIR